jgi:choline kinase
MTALQTAIILAAGAGRRMKAVAEVPKALLPLSGQAGDERFVDFQLVTLAKAGVRSVVIVGTRHVVRAPMRSILTLGPGVEVRFVQIDEEPAIHGSAHSLARALQEADDLTSNRRIVIVEATTVASQSVWQRLRDHEADRSAVVVDRTATGRHVGESEAWIAPGAPARVARLGRGLEGTPATEGMARAGTTPGLTVVAADDVARLRQALAWGLQHSSGRGRFRVDEALQMLVERGRVDAVTAGADDVVHAVRTPEDYARLTQQVWPVLKASRS